MVKIYLVIINLFLVTSVLNSADDSIIKKEKCSPIIVARFDNQQWKSEHGLLTAIPELKSEMEMYLINWDHDRPIWELVLPTRLSSKDVRLKIVDDSGRKVPVKRGNAMVRIFSQKCESEGIFDLGYVIRDLETNRVVSAVGYTQYDGVFGGYVPYTNKKYTDELRIALEDCNKMKAATKAAWYNFKKSGIFSLKPQIK